MSDQNGASEHTTDIYVPVDSSATPIKWDGNPAKIAGIRFECSQYYKRKGIFGPLLKHRAVLLGNGKIAVPHINTVEFLLGNIADPKTYDKASEQPTTASSVAPRIAR